MSGILEIIFQGFLEWAYTLILEIWEFFSTALLNIMSMDFAYLQSRIPILPVLQQSFLAVGWALLIGNLVFQSVRSMLSGLGFDAEDPKLLFSRTFVFSFLLVASPQICDIALNMTAAVIRMMEMPNAVAITTLSEGAFAGLGTAWLLVIICGVVVMYQSVKLFVEMAERYFILCMLTITSPMAFGLGGSRSTSDIFSHWCRMYGSMCLLMVMNVVFIKILMSVLAYSPTGPDVLPWMVLVMAVVRTAKKFDSIVSRLGLNPAITNEPRVPGMLSLMVARTMMSNAAKVISQNGAQGAGRSGGSGPPPSGTGNGHGSGGENRNDRRDFNGNRNADKGGQRNPGEERDRRGRNRNGGSPPPDSAPSSGGRGGGQRGSNSGGSDAKRGSGGGQNRDAASSGAKKKDGGQRETNGGGQGYRRNSGESGGAQRNRSYRNPNAPPDSPPESGRNASRSFSQESGRQSSSDQFDGRRPSPQTSFTQNGDGVSSNGGGQSPREQGFTESGRRDTGKTSAPRNGQPSPARSETRAPDSAPVSRTATGNPAERAPSSAAPKKGGSDGGHGADGQSTRHSERPQEKASRQTPGGSPTPLSSSRTRTDSDSHSGVTQSRAERTSATTRADVSSKESGLTSVMDSRFTQRGESAAQGKAKDGAVTPQSDAAHTPPHTPPETPPRNVTSPVTQGKASPDRETASGSGETRFSNRSASSATTTASSTVSNGGAKSRRVPPPDEKPGFSSADTRFTNRPSSPTTNAEDSAQSHAEGQTTSVTSKPDAAPRNVTGSAPQGTVTLNKDKETASGSEDTRFTNRAASGDAASASQKAAPVSQTSASASGAASNGVAHSDKKETGSNSGETRFSNRTASPSAASASQTSAATNGATSKSAVSSERKDASAHSEDTRFTSRSASSNALPASAGASGVTATSGVPSDKKETASNPGDARFSNRAAPGNATVTSQTSTVTDSASNKETTSNAEATRFTNHSVPGNASSASQTPATADNAPSASRETRFSNRAASQTSMSASGVTSKSAASSDKETASNAEETRFSNRTAAQTPAAASGAPSDKEASSDSEETRFSNRTASQMSTVANAATPGSVSSDKKGTGSNSGDTRFTNRAVSFPQTPAANNSVHADKETASNSEETRFSNRAASQNAASVSQTSAVTGGVTSRSVSLSDKEADSNSENARFSNRAASQTSVAANGTASKSAIPSDKKETGSNSGESRFTNRPVPSDTVSAPPAPANGVNAQGGSSKSNMETDSASGETRFTSRPTSGNAVPAPPASATVSTASSNRTETARHSGDSRFTNRAASGDATSPSQTSATTGGGTSKGVPSSDKHAPSDSGETRFSNRPAPSDNASAPPAPTAASGATAKSLPSPDRNADSASEETRFTSRSVSGNAVSATPTPTVTGGGTSKTVPSPNGETPFDSGDSRFMSRPVSPGASAVSAVPPPAVVGGSALKDSSTVKETNSDSGGTRFTSRPASPVAASRSPVAADGGTSPDRFSAASNRTPEHTGATENRAAVVKPDNAGNSDAQVVISQTGAPPSHVVSSGKADGGVTESRFSQRDSAKMAGQSHSAAPIPAPLPKADNSRGGVTGGASAHDTRQSARERVPAVTPSDFAKSAPARPERGETPGQSVVTTATPERVSSAVPRPPVSGGGSEQNATRQSAMESAGQNNGRPDHGASETSAAAKADAAASHPATVPPRVGGGNRETPTHPDRPGTEKRSATVSETPAPRQQASRSGADASGKTVNSDERRGSAKQPGESASPVSQRPSTFNNNAAPPRPVTRETAAGYGETQRQPRRNADVPSSGASEGQENPTRRGEQSPRKMYASDNGVPTRPNAERTQRRADQPAERPQPNVRKDYPLNREQRTSQTVRDSDNHSVPVRSATGTANRADSARQREQDNSERRPDSPDTAAGQRPGRSNQTRTPPGMYAPDNGAPARLGKGMTEGNDARRPDGQPRRNDNAAPSPDGHRPPEQRGKRRAPDTRDTEGYDRVPILNGAAGKRDSATRPNPGRGKSAVPPPGRYHDAEWHSVPPGRENATPQTPPRNGKEAPRGGVTENGRPKTPSASKEDKRPLFDFFGFGGGKRK